MSFFGNLFGREEKKSAAVAKDRLMIAIATDRQNTLIPYMDEMRMEIIKVLEKYIKIDDIEIKKERKGEIDLLEIEVMVQKS
ncbi:cell division topological specificity factor MinE [Hydrogenimonas sp.]